ncbi:carbon-nitrogen hydrolase [Aspergillus egyptiacus]|nr:carbon-nitrogen hydrolase [Aspergillus egyptiacus]
MRIATLQFAPKLGDVEGNIKRANAVLKDASIKAPPPSNGQVGVEDAKLDILILPELALTGYNFPSLTAIKPYVEPTGQGPSATWARETARRLRCKVCVGYPEIHNDPTTQEVKYYNSLLVIDERGEVILNYRKAFLYYTDETWASEGSSELGFHQLTFPSVTAKAQIGAAAGAGLNLESEPASTDAKKGKVEIATSFGICMDINPYRFEAPYTAWEFAHRVLDSKSQLVILSMAWLTLLSRDELDALADKPDLDTFNYWIQRFMPLVRKRMAHASNADSGASFGSEESESESEGMKKNIIIVFSNRAGEEDGSPPARYAGTSAVIAVEQRPRPRTGMGLVREHLSGSDGEEEGEQEFDVRILCWDILGATSEGVCFADTRGDPRMVFQLVKAAG